MQLVAYGAQDVYLTGNPKVTFFQAVYKRHTNFAMEMIEQTVNGTAGDSGRISVTVARNGDLIGNMYLEVTPSASAKTVGNYAVGSNVWIAEAAVQDVELTIGGQRIDKHYQRWWRLYAELYLNDAKKGEWGKVTGGDSLNQTATGAVRLPLIFFFNRNPGLYLPLIALQYHEVRLDFDLSADYSKYFATNGVKVWGNYVYLDTEERRRFAQKGHEYLIEQVQHTGADGVAAGSNNTRLSYNHPVKEIVWCYNTDKTSGASAQLNQRWAFVNDTTKMMASCDIITAAGADALTNNVMVAPHQSGCPFLVVGSNGAAGAALGGAQLVEEADVTSAQVQCGPLETFKLILNGQDRFKEQPGTYFNQYQPLQYHSGNPMAGIYSYSFGLKPEEHQPTGTCNFSRIDNAQVSSAIKTTGAAAITKMSMFAVNYNVLRVQSGMGGLAFSN